MMGGRSGRKIQAVDLFCGAGGLTRGLLDAGITVRAGVDLEPSCRYAYESNNSGVEFVERSVSELCGGDVSAYFEADAISLLCGCAPCQTFSTMNQKDEAGRRRSARWKLLDEFGRLIEEASPQLVSMENVPGLMKQDVFQRFVGKLDDLGYHVDYRVIDCADYGMPQRRRRLVLVASRFDEIRLPNPNPNIPRATVRSAIGSLSAIPAGGRDVADMLHDAASLSSKNLKRIKASKAGGTWRDWPDELLAECHKSETGDGYGAVYGRMEWDEPAPTITTQFYNYGSGRFGHPEQDRALSLREGAILQGFPRDYRFCDSDANISKRQLGVMIGNAVPVGLGKLVGDTLMRHVQALVARRIANDAGDGQLSNY